MGVVSVRGRSLVPSPPTRTTACITWWSLSSKVCSRRGRRGRRRRGRRDARHARRRGGWRRCRRRSRRRGGCDGLAPSGQHLQQRSDAWTSVAWGARRYDGHEPDSDQLAIGELEVSRVDSGEAAGLLELAVLAGLRRQHPPAGRPSPTLPASGVPAGHFSPFLYSFEEGYFKVVLVSVRPLYPLGELAQRRVVPCLA